MAPSLRTSAALFALLTAFAPRAAADVKLPPVLSSHMVLQREAPVPIWGTAAPGEKVTVKFRDQEKTATAGDNGKWFVKLDALKAGGPDALTVAGKNTLTLEDVLVGEVWVGSGQSNMAGNVGSYAKGDEVLAKLAADTYPKVRLSTNGGTWNEAKPPAINGFSAILFSFGVKLQKDLDVPVGLMVGAVGGTPSGYWLSEDAFKADAGVKAQIAAAMPKYDAAAAKTKYEADLAKWEVAAKAAKDAGKNPPGKPILTPAPGESRGAKIGNLYERQIRPMQPFAIRGVLWDQGESGTIIEGVDQYTVMGALMNGWRKEWGQDFPFILVQKPSGGGCAFDPKDPVTAQGEPFAPLPPAVPAVDSNRMHYISIMRHPKTYLAIASDLGSGIHPTNKSGYGSRAERVALGAVYAKKVEYHGPVYKSHMTDGNKVKITFTHVGQGLTFQHGNKLQGFAVAGGDGLFVWADAVIDGDTVVVSSDKVSKPTAIRYAAASRHPWANLFNKDGLPAIPFNVIDTK